MNIEEMQNRITALEGKVWTLFGLTLTLAVAMIIILLHL